jgi:hypothetical protein
VTGAVATSSRAAREGRASIGEGPGKLFLEVARMPSAKSAVLAAEVAQ